MSVCQSVFPVTMVRCDHCGPIQTCSLGEAGIWSLTERSSISVPTSHWDSCCYCLPMTLQAGNVYSSVCLFRGGFSMWSLPMMHGASLHWATKTRRIDKQAVRILLECFRVLHCFLNLIFGSATTP